MIYPNQLTVLRIILTPVFLFLFLAEDPLLKQISLIVYLVAAITDWYDGWLARKFNYITEWGKFLDPLADKILTSGAFIAFVIIGVLNLWMVLIIILRDFLITGLRIFADYKKVSFATSRLAQWKTFLQMAFIYYLLLFYTLRTVDYLNNAYSSFFSSVLNPDLVFWSMLFVMMFTLITGIMYLFTNRKLILQLIKIEN